MGRPWYMPGGEMPTERRPQDAAREVLTELCASERGAEHLLTGLDRRGLTVCWKAPSDG